MLSDEQLIERAEWRTPNAGLRDVLMRHSGLTVNAANADPRQAVANFLAFYGDGTDAHTATVESVEFEMLVEGQTKRSDGSIYQFVIGTRTLTQYQIMDLMHTSFPPIVEEALAEKLAGIAAHFVDKIEFFRMVDVTSSLGRNAALRLDLTQITNANWQTDIVRTLILRSLEDSVVINAAISSLGEKVVIDEAEKPVEPVPRLMDLLSKFQKANPVNLLKILSVTAVDFETQLVDNPPKTPMAKTVANTTIASLLMLHVQTLDAVIKKLGAQAEARPTVGAEVAGGIDGPVQQQ